MASTHGAALTPHERFWARVEPDQNGCLIWRGPVGAKGYGRFVPVYPQAVMAHRFAYEDQVGPIPAGLTLDHLCRVHACVNPDHLEPVTNRENVLRGGSPAASSERLRNRHARARLAAVEAAGE